MRANGTFLRSVAVAAVLTAAVGAGSAYAADVVYQEPPAPTPIEMLPVASWAGPYAGLNFGYGFGGTVTGAGLGAPVNGASGWVFGGFAGYNWQTGNFVYGLEADLGYNGVNGGNGAGQYFRSGLEGSLRARLGYAATDTMLIYATAGGMGTQQAIHDVTGFGTATAWGWTAGAGIDAKLTDAVFGRLEYRYTDPGSVAITTPGNAYTINSSHHRVTVGMGVKF